MQAKRYAYKCHRRTEDGQERVYPVNALAFHPVYGTFASGGDPGPPVLHHPMLSLLTCSLSIRHPAPHHFA